MTVNGICHTLWEIEGNMHLCGKAAEHVSWHGCACGAVLHVNTSTLTDEQRRMRSKDCPECLAKKGRPCHTTRGAVMSGVHSSRLPRE